MGLFEYLGSIGLAVVMGAYMRWSDSSGVARLSRLSGLGGRSGWAIGTLAVMWAFAPVLFDADTDGRIWLFGPAIAGTGMMLIGIAVGSLDEYRLLDRVSHVAPSELSASDGGRLVATSGIPVPLSEGDAAETPFTGRPAVHADWHVQRRGQVGFRNVWKTVASDVEDTGFRLGDGAVYVRPAEHRAFSNAETRREFSPDEDLPEPAVRFLQANNDLPSPDSLTERIRLVEAYVPADEPITVVGRVEQATEPGTVVIEDAPSEFLEVGAGDVVLIRGDAEDAYQRMRKRVYWVGTGGVVLLIAGQVLGFWLSSATIPV
jgi:hypothetical protein